MKLSNTTIYTDEDAIDLLHLNGWEFENCIFKDLNFEKQGLQDLPNVAYCSSKHIKTDKKDAKIYSGEYNIDGSYYPSLAFAQLSHSIFLVPKDQWREKLLHFVKSNVYLFDFTESMNIQLDYTPTEIGNTALFIMRRENDSLPYYLEPRSLLGCLFKNNRVGRYNITKTLANQFDASLFNIHSSLLWDLFEELLDNSALSLFNLPTTNTFQLVKLRKWLIEHIIAFNVDIKVPKILAKVTLTQLKKFSAFLYEKQYFEQLYPMSSIVLLIIESIELVNQSDIQLENAIFDAFNNDPASLIKTSIA